MAWRDDPVVDAPAGGGWMKDPVVEPKGPSADPTEGMGTVDRLLAGTGRGMSAATRAALDGFSRLVGANSVGANLVPQSAFDEARKLDAPLLSTTAGKFGNVVGQAAVAAPTAFIPGANTYTGAGLIGAGLGALTTEGGLQDRAQGAGLGALGGVAGKGVGDALGAGAGWLAGKARGAFAGQQAANSQRMGAAQAASDAGYVIPPADLQPGTLSNLVSGFSGKIKTAQEASARNQPVTNTLARRELNIPPDVPLNIDTLKAIRSNAGQAYQAVSGAGVITPGQAYTQALDDIVQPYVQAAKAFPNAKPNPIVDEINALRSGQFDAASAVAKIKTLRADADAAYGAGNKDLGKALKSGAGALEDAIDAHLAASNAPAQLLQQFREARQTIAKTYSVEKALNSETGDVSAQALANQLRRGRPLSGHLRTAAQAGMAFPKATQALKEAPGAVSPLDWAMAAGMGTATGGPIGLAGLAMRPAARSLLLSGPYQRAALQQAAGPGLLSQLPEQILNQQLLRNGLPGAGGLLAAGLLPADQ